MPDDGIEPILSSIDAATQTLDIKMFLFTEVALIDAVLAAHHRGVRVRVMLNPARRSGESENIETVKILLSAGINVKDTHETFAVTHEKSIVIDQQAAYICTLNWARKHFTHTRDYALITQDPLEVQETLECFNADWERKPFHGQDSSLIWCTGNGRSRIARIIDEAKDYLYIQNERYQDPTIIERLVRAKSRGLRIHLMALPPHTLKQKKLLEGVNGMRLMSDVGIKIHKLEGLHLHAKMLLADGKRAMVGSINLTPGSFDERRELAIELSDRPIVKRLRHVFEQDWGNSHRLDLSDRGIKKDLEKHGLEDHGSLALDASE
jgi:cardiolipin synthase A/B